MFTVSVSVVIQMSCSFQIQSMFISLKNWKLRRHSTPIRRWIVSVPERSTTCADVRSHPASQSRCFVRPGWQRSCSCCNPRWRFFHPRQPQQTPVCSDEPHHTMRGSMKNARGVCRRIVQDQLNVSIPSNPSGESRRNFCLLHPELHSTDFERVNQSHVFRVCYLEYFLYPWILISLSLPRAPWKFHHPILWLMPPIDKFQLSFYFFCFCWCPNIVVVWYLKWSSQSSIFQRHPLSSSLTMIEDL